jgi:hypothetical protein
MVAWFFGFVHHDYRISHVYYVRLCDPSHLIVKQFQFADSVDDEKARDLSAPVKELAITRSDVLI